MAAYVTSEDTIDLIERVHSLPPELFDNIKDLVFTPATDAVDITEDYEPPLELQISGATREHFATRYYSNTTFRMIEKVPVAVSREHYRVFIMWLNSLEKHHRLSIKKLHLVRAKIQLRDEAKAERFGHRRPLEQFRKRFGRAMFLMKTSFPHKDALDPATTLSVDLLVKDEEAGVRTEKVCCTFSGSRNA